MGRFLLKGQARRSHIAACRFAALREVLARKVIRRARIQRKERDQISADRFKVMFLRLIRYLSGLRRTPIASFVYPCRKRCIIACFSDQL